MRYATPAALAIRAYEMLYAIYGDEVPPDLMPSDTLRDDIMAMIVLIRSFVDQRRVDQAFLDDMADCLAAPRPDDEVGRVH